MATWIANIRGNPGPMGARGAEGPAGAPGAGQVPTDQAIAGNVGTEGTLSRGAVQEAASVLVPARPAFSGATPTVWEPEQVILTRAQIDSVMQPSGQGRVPYTPCIIRVPDGLPGQLGKYYMYWSTDHSTGRGGIHMAYADHPTGPWTPLDVTTLTIPAWMQGMPKTGTTTMWRDTYHKDLTAWSDFEQIPAGLTGTQTETPWVMPDLSGERKLIMYYQTRNPAELVTTLGAQSTFFAKSDDGISWVRGVKPIATNGVMNDYTRAQALIFPFKRIIPGDGHTGYAAFYDVGSQRIGYSSSGGTSWSRQAMWLSGDGMTFRMDPRRLSYRADISGADDMKITGMFRLFQWRGEIWGTTNVQSPGSGTESPAMSQVLVGRMRPDMRWFAGAVYEANFKPSSTVDGGDGYLYGVGTSGDGLARTIIVRRLRA